jgi:uncharacterized membrane protein HdeD (DUF308 family)
MLVINPNTQQSWVRNSVKAVSSNWWLLLLNGIVGVVAGGLILAIDWTIADLAVFIGVLLFVRGIFTAFSLPLNSTARMWTVVMGLLEIGTGVAIFVWPNPTLLVVAALIGWWVLFSGVMTIGGSIATRHVMPYWGLALTLGIVETVLAFYLLGQPGLTLLTAVLAVGIWSTFYGVMEIAVAFEVKNLPNRFDEAVRDVSTPFTPQASPAAVRAS